MADLLIAAVALLHIGFMILEMFLWEKPVGLNIFRMSPEKAATTAVLAANQGLYNGFLAAGLFWSLVHPDAAISSQIATFFLCCVLIAGLYGGWSVNRRIFLIQSAPALLAMVLLHTF
jgi:putative membrane protein